MSPVRETRTAPDAFDMVAEGYDEAAGRYYARYAADLIDLLYPQKGERALDLGGGTGGAGLRLAERIGSEGGVTIVDPSPAALQAAAAGAAARGLTNVATRVMDAQKLQFPDASFDILVCCMAVMDFADTRRALGEVCRVLKPGGRAGFTVWSRPDRVPYYSAPALALLRRRGPPLTRIAMELPLLGGRIRNWRLGRSHARGFSPFRFWKPGDLERLLMRSGLTQTRREWRAFPLEYPSFEAYWDAFLHGTPAARGFAAAPNGTLSEIKSELRDQFVNPRTGEVLIWNEAALVLAKKPERD